MEAKDDRKLFKFEYYEPEDSATYTDWVWLYPAELASYKSSYEAAEVRLATKEEEELYEEAYQDGYGLAAVLEFESRDNGVTYRLEMVKDLDAGDFITHKMFKCAICDKHKDFATEVATANNYYLTELRDEILWHVCYDCAELGLQITQAGDLDSQED